VRPQKRKGMRDAVPTGSPSDESLLDAFAGGDDSAFASLYSRYRERVTLYAWRLLRRREDAEEVCAEVFTTIARGTWRPTGTFRAFLFTITHRRCVDRLRRRRRRARLLPWLRQADRSDETPEDAAAHDEQLRRLERALSALSGDLRTVVLLYYGEELPSREVAKILDCTDQQVRSRLSYARRKLRGVMLPEEEP